MATGVYGCLSVASMSSSTGGGLRLAYLGPQGSYGHQAFAGSIHPQPELLPCPTIPYAELLAMPLQNLDQGIVMETLGCLLDSNAEAGPSRSTQRSRPVIVADLDLPIRHCLVARRGVTMKDIRNVRSHEQALGQSSIFLKKHLPDAEIEKWSSTSEAALSLLDSDDGLFSGALCSRTVVNLHPGLEVLYEGTQNIQGNRTRFLLLVRDTESTRWTVEPQPRPTSFYAAYDGADLQIIGSQVKSVVSVAALPTGTRQLSQESACRYPLAYLVEVEHREGQPLSAGTFLGSSAYHIALSRP